MQKLGREKINVQRQIFFVFYSPVPLLNVNCASVQKVITNTQHAWWRVERQNQTTPSNSPSSTSTSTAAPSIFFCELSTRPHGLHSRQSLLPGGGTSSTFSNMEARLLTKYLFMVRDGREFLLSLFLAALIVLLILEDNHCIFCFNVAQWREQDLSNTAALGNLSVLHLSVCGAGEGDDWPVLAVLLLFLVPFTLPRNSLIFIQLSFPSQTFFLVTMKHVHWTRLVSQPLTLTG